LSGERCKQQRVTQPAQQVNVLGNRKHPHHSSQVECTLAKPFSHVNSGTAPTAVLQLLHCLLQWLNATLVELKRRQAAVNTAPVSSSYSRRCVRCLA
jgi:hypothetical protein